MHIKTPTAIAVFIVTTLAGTNSWGQSGGTAPPPRIAVSPPRVEIDLDAGHPTEAIHVINLSDKETRISVSVAHWDLDENNKVRDIAPTEQSLDQWIVINPLEFAIPPGEQQTLRFAIRPRIAPMAGEHRAMIYLEQQPDEVGDASSSVNIRYRVGVAVYGLSGQIDRRGGIRAIRHTTSGENQFLDVDTISEGNASVRLSGRYGIWPQADYPGDEDARTILDEPQDGPENRSGVVGTLPQIPILPGTARIIRARLPDLPPGAYSLYVSGSVSGRPFAERLEITAS